VLDDQDTTRADAGATFPGIGRALQRIATSPPGTSGCPDGRRHAERHFLSRWLSSGECAAKSSSLEL
jgi:hypothetical protein